MKLILMTLSVMAFCFLPQAHAGDLKSYYTKCDKKKNSIGGRSKCKRYGQAAVMSFAIDMGCSADAVHNKADELVHSFRNHGEGIKSFMKAFKANANKAVSVCHDLADEQLEDEAASIQK